MFFDAHTSYLCNLGFQKSHFHYKSIATGNSKRLPTLIGDTGVAKVDVPKLDTST